jgi:alcohol dehydrogenase class IV
VVSRFEFATAQRVIFGMGVLQEAGLLAKALGKRPLVVTGRDASRCERLLERLGSQGLLATRYALSGEPTLADVRAGVAQARAANADLVIGFGGGSALDGAKAIAALAVNSGDPVRYLELIGEGLPLERRPLPCMAIPTTAGTGSEVTRNAVLASPEHGVKVSLRHVWMLPQVALVDPELALGLPPEITASTGLDALTQLIEPFLSARANPLTDALCREGIPKVARSLHRACENGQDASAREDMALASLLGGMALANAGLGAVHGLAAPLGGMRPVPHGVACAALLPYVLEANLDALRSCEQSHPVLARFTELAQLLTGNPDADAQDGIRWTQALVEELQIPRLERYGLEATDLEVIAARAMTASSMQANPVKLDVDTLVRILTRAL